MNYWLHRISHYKEISYPLLDNGYLSIGWSWFTNPNEIIKEKSLLEKEFVNKNKPKSVHSLSRFLYEMKKYDYIIIPHPYRFSVYRLIDDAVLLPKDLEIDNLQSMKLENDKLYKNDETYVDLGFFRRAECVEKDILRKDYADKALTSRLKIFNTNANITDLNESIELAINSYREKKPINLFSSIIESNLDKTLTIIKEKINDFKFEKLIQWYFKRIGAKVYVPPKRENDKKGDVDVIATFEAIKIIIYVQAKKHDGNTSDWALDQVTNYVENKKSLEKESDYSKICWVVSTCDDFSDACKEKAVEEEVMLIDGKMFAQMIIECGINDLDI